MVVSQQLSSSPPSNDDLSAKIREILPRVDINTMGVKSFVKLLSKEMGDVDLKSRKDFIKETLAIVINEQNTNDFQGEVGNDDNDDDHDDDDEGEDEFHSQQGNEKSSGGGGGLSKEKELSDKLAVFFGRKMMCRTAIVSELWAYIRLHQLQNPSNKREIILDQRLRDVFGCDKFTMFTMNKYISCHVHPFKPVDLTSSPIKSAAGKKRQTRGHNSKNKASSKKRKVGTQPPYRLSEALQAIVGTDILPRPQVVSRIWAYIKENNLQNELDKREILCDDKMKRVMKHAKISMFKMNTYIGEHLIEKLDRSMYQHDVNEEESDADEE